MVLERGQERTFDGLPNSTQYRNSMGFQCLDDTVEDQTDTYCGDEKANDAGNGINPHLAQFGQKLARISQAQVRHKHGGDDGRHYGDK